MDSLSQSKWDRTGRTKNFDCEVFKRETSSDEQEETKSEKLSEVEPKNDALDTPNSQSIPDSTEGKMMDEVLQGSSARKSHDQPLKIDAKKLKFYEDQLRYQLHKEIK